jgi:cell division protein FtsX
MPCPVALAKEIHEAINRRAGITDADLSDFFEDCEEFDEELDDGDEVLDNNPPHEITVATNEVANVTQPERNDEQPNNLQPTFGAAVHQQPTV